MGALTVIRFRSNLQDPRDLADSDVQRLPLEFGLSGFPRDPGRSIFPCCNPLPTRCSGDQCRNRDYG